MRTVFLFNAAAKSGAERFIFFASGFPATDFPTSGFAFKPAYRVRAELNIRCMVMQAGIMVDSFFLNAFQLISGSERHICRVIIIYVAANNNPVNPGGKQFRFHGFDCFGHIPPAGFRQAQPITQFRGPVQKTDVVHTDTTEKIIFIIFSMPLETARPPQAQKRLPTASTPDWA